MDVEGEVLRIQKKLSRTFYHNGLGQEQALDLLKLLQGLPVNPEILSRTRIGVTVNSLCKSSPDQQVKNLARLLIKKWKKIYRKHVNSIADKHRLDRMAAASFERRSRETVESNTETETSVERYASNRAGDSIRLKRRTMLANLFRHDAFTDFVDAISSTPEELAALFEEAMHQGINNRDSF